MLRAWIARANAALGHIFADGIHFVAVVSEIVYEEIGYLRVGNFFVASVRDVQSDEPAALAGAWKHAGVIGA